jgi:hypothetical protein
MYGEAVALRVWGGGWLKWQDNTVGADVALSDAPSYEWYVVSGNLRPGAPIDSRPAYQADEFALWNSRADAYLIYHYDTFGVSLGWWKDTSPPASSVHDASVYMTRQTPTEGWVPFLATYGGGPGNTGELTKVSNPNNFPLVFPTPGYGSQDCGTTNVTLAAGATMPTKDMVKLWPNPSLAQKLNFLACVGGQQGAVLQQVAVNVEYVSP